MCILKTPHILIPIVKFFLLFSLLVDVGSSQLFSGSSSVSTAPLSLLRLIAALQN